MKFRKKPVVIEAVQWTGPQSAAAILDLTDFMVSVEEFEGRQVVTISTLEGTMRGEIGDWIIKGVKGEFYPCKPDIFEANYEPEPNPSPAPEVMGTPERPGRTKLLIKFWAAMHEAGFAKDQEWDAQEHIHIVDLVRLLTPQPDPLIEAKEDLLPAQTELRICGACGIGEHRACVKAFLNGQKCDCKLCAPPETRATEGK